MRKTLNKNQMQELRDAKDAFFDLIAKITPSDERDKDIVGRQMSNWVLAGSTQSKRVARLAVVYSAWMFDDSRWGLRVDMPATRSVVRNIGQARADFRDNKCPEVLVYRDDNEEDEISYAIPLFLRKRYDRAFL